MEKNLNYASYKKTNAFNKVQTSIDHLDHLNSEHLQLK